MKCQILFSCKNKKNIVNLSSAEFDQRGVKVILQALEVQTNQSLNYIDSGGIQKQNL